MAKIEVKPESRADLKGVVTILKKYFKKQNFPFEYDERDEWNDENVIAHTNCYRYAFNMPWTEDDQRIMAYLGWSYGKLYQHVSGEAGYVRFEIDLKRMGFKFEVTTDEINLPSKGYKIALYIYESDFHFARQNADGRWSEKNGFGAPVELLTDEDGNPITPSQVPQESDNYSLRIYHLYR